MEIGKVLGPHITELDSLLAAMELMKSSRLYAFLYSVDFLKYFLLKNEINSYYICEKPNVENVFTIDLIAIAMRTDFPYKNQFNKL